MITVIDNDNNIVININNDVRVFPKLVTKVELIKNRVIIKDISPEQGDIVTLDIKNVSNIDAANNKELCEIISGFLNPKLNEDNIVIQYLLNSGSKNMAVDGTTPVIFKAAPAVGKKWEIGRMILYYEDTIGFSANTFGSMPALSNGVSILINNKEVLNWKDNLDVMTSMFDADGKEAYAKADRSIGGRLSFFKFNNIGGVEITDNENGYGVKIQDDLSGLLFFRIRIEGIEKNA